MGQASASSLKTPHFDIRYPYVQIRRQHYPLIPLTLHLSGQSVRTFGLLDSGASISLFRPEIAKALKIPLSIRHGQALKMAKGKISALICKVDLQVEDVRFSTFIGFSDRHAASFNIIGRQGFFEHFGVYFDESRRRIGLIRK